MKKAPLLTVLLILAFAASACASANATNSTGGLRAGTTGGTRTLNPETRLALGTIKLEGTPEAVDSKLAAKLIPLWQLLIQLNSSSSTAPQEVSAVMDAINAAMAPAQLHTIEGMSLTQADLFTVFQEQSQSSTSGAGSSGFIRRNGGGGGAIFFGGGPGGPGGGFGGGFGGGGFGGAGTRNGTGTGSTTTGQLDAAQAAQAAQARQNAISDLVINQLIRLLQTKLRS